MDVTTIHTDLCDLLGIEHPIMQGGMGPYGTADLAPAVSNAGGMGTISNMGPDIGPDEASDRWETIFDQVCEATDNNFAANLPLGAEGHTPQKVVETIDGYMETALRLKQENQRVADQFELMITSAGNPARWHDEIADAGLLHFHKVGSVKHARKAEEVGCDGVIASGFEMGGHTHLPEEAVHTFTLVPAVTDAVDIPVVVAGGVRDGKGLLAALSMGAVGVSMGTRFIATTDSGWHENYKRYIQSAGEKQDRVIGGLYSPALRGLKSEGLEELADLQGGVIKSGADDFMDVEYEKLDAATKQGDVDDGLVSAGQIACYIDDVPSVEELIDQMIADAVTHKRRLDNYVRD